jgi:hypothetical protein
MFTFSPEEQDRLAFQARLPALVSLDNSLGRSPKRAVV